MTEHTPLPSRVQRLLLEAVGSKVAADLAAQPDTPLSLHLSHADRALLFHSLRRARPDIDAAAFWDSSTSVSTLEAWVGSPAEPDPESAIKRGDYRTERVALRELTPSDLDRLYHMAMEPSNAHRWRYQGRSLSPEDFRATIFSRSVLCQFAVVATNGQLVGCVTAYDADFLGGHCAIAAFGGGAHSAGRGAVAEGCGILIEYVLDHFPFHKIFLEMPEYNSRLLKGSMDGIAALEAEISDYYFFAGQRWSKQIYSITRHHWEGLISNHLPAWDLT